MQQFHQRYLNRRTGCLYQRPTLAWLYVPGSIGPCEPVDPPRCSQGVSWASSSAASRVWRSLAAPGVCPPPDAAWTCYVSLAQWFIIYDRRGWDCKRKESRGRNAEALWRQYFKGFWCLFSDVTYLSILSLISLFLALIASAVRDFLLDGALFLVLTNDLDFLTSGMTPASCDLVLLSTVCFPSISQLLFTHFLILGKVNFFSFWGFFKCPRDWVTWSGTAGSWSGLFSCHVLDLGAITGGGSRSQWVHVSPCVAGLSFTRHCPGDSHRWNKLFGWLVDILLRCSHFSPGGTGVFSDGTAVFCVVLPQGGGSAVFCASLSPDGSAVFDTHLPSGDTGVFSDGTGDFSDGTAVFCVVLLQGGGTAVFCAGLSSDGSAMFDTHLPPGVACVLFAEGALEGSGVLVWPWPWSDLEGQAGLLTSGPFSLPILRAWIWK